MVSPPPMLMDQAFAASTQAMVITDAWARIIAVNAAFTTVTGYAEAEALGQSPAMLQSGHHGAPFYAKLWGALKAHGHWEGEVWNRRKNGEIYTEYLSIDALYAGGRTAHGASVGANAGYGAGYDAGYGAGDDYGGEDEAEVYYFATFSDITARKLAEDRLRKMAFADRLTALPNRALFEDRLDRAVELGRRRENPLAVAILDMDRFKEINDRFGHSAGDHVLKAVARRLTGQLRTSDTVARWGGDEFTVLLPDIGRNENAAGIAAKLLDALTDDVRIDGQAVSLQASIGVSLFPLHADNAVDLVRLADAAMYQAKHEGRHGYQIYTPLAA